VIDFWDVISIAQTLIPDYFNLGMMGGMNQIHRYHFIQHFSNDTKPRLLGNFS